MLALAGATKVWLGLGLGVALLGSLSVNWWLYRDRSYWRDSWQEADRRASEAERLAREYVKLVLVQRIHQEPGVRHYLSARSRAR